MPVVTNSSGVSIQLDMPSYHRLRNAIEKLSSHEWYRGIVRDHVTAMLDTMVLYASSISHVWTGMLRQSHTRKYDSHTMKGSVFVDPDIQARDIHGRPKSIMVAEYATIEHAQGGSHAFYERTIKEMGPAASMRAIADMVSDMDRRLASRSY